MNARRADSPRPGYSVTLASEVAREGQDSGFSATPPQRAVKRVLKALWRVSLNGHAAGKSRFHELLRFAIPTFSPAQMIK